MKQRILQVITSLLLIITLTMANFLLLCADVVSYAAETVSINKNTNNKNIEFMTYFKDEKGNKNTEINAYTNSSDLKLYFQISVKQEGYFNGSILLNNANFKLKTEVLSDSINKIENNIIYLNQINAGENKEIEVGIELLKDEQFDLDFISMQSEISLEGIYRDSTQKDILINAKRNINLNLVSPYTNSEESILLSQEIITNKIINYNGEDKRIIQVEVKSGINNNLFPIKKSVINIQSSKFLETYPETVLVNANNVLVTNGKMLTSDNWNYDNETGLITINLENVEENGKVSWIKNGEDKIIITYIVDKETKINNEELVATSKIELYDINNTNMEKLNEIALNSDEKNAIVTSNIIQNETSIYKGKLYAGISRDITYRNIINVNLNNVADEINVKENKQTLETTEINAVYKTSRISKLDVEKILGETGTLNIINAENGNVIAEINKNSEANENGDIIITYPGNVKTIIVKLLSPENIGKIEIENTKTIKSVNKNVVKTANSINLKANTSYALNDTETELEDTESSIELKETETSADLQISRTELSAMTSNNNVELRVVLNSREERNELFKNPVVRVELPKKIESIEINSIKLIYEDELKVKSANLNDNVIEIALEGEQTKYKEEAIDGAIIIINANLKTNTKIPSSTEEVKLTYTNANAINYKDNGTVVKNINIVSYAGVVTINQISAYGIDVVNNEGTKSSELAISEAKKEVTIDKKIINNKENKISNVKILGIFPTKEAISTNNIDIEVGNIKISGIDLARTKVYYSNNENATEDLENAENNWTENIEDNKNVKKYLVVVDEMDLLEEIDLSYNISIPANLEYNESAEEGYTVYYTNVTTVEKVNVNNIRLATPRGTVVETQLKTLVAGKESDEVKENETLRYAIVVANTGSEDVSNVKITAKVPEGTTYVNTDKLNNEVDLDNLKFEDSDKKDVEFNIEKLAQGEKVTKYYEVKINDGMANKEISNTVTTQYGEVSKTSSEVKTKILDGELELKLISVDAKDGIVNSGYQYRYVLYITNKSDKDMKNVKTTINTNNNLKISQMYYIDSDDKAVMTENSNNIEIDKIQSGETIELAIYTTVSIFKDDTSKNISITATSVVNKEEYNSNEVNMIAKSNLLLSMKVTSENSGNYVKTGDTIKYNVVIKNEGKDTAKIVTLNNWIPNDVTLTKVTKNGTELSKDNYSLEIDENRNQKVLRLQENSIESGKTIEYQIEVVTNLLYGNTETIELISEYSLKIDSFEIDTFKIEHILQPDKNSSDTENSGNGENQGEGESNSGSENNEQNEYKIISGVAWVDENEDGQRGMNEKTVEGITVKLLNTTTNEFAKDSDGNVLSTTTSSTGFYSFNKVEKGQYLVIFEYDTTQYGLTAFEKDGVSNEMNSNVITKNINIEGTEKKVAATEVVNVNDTNISNINIGLIVAKKYDLQLDKYISKVTVQNNKTVTNTYKDVTFAKQEIDAKQVNSTIVVVEYTIKVTNNGDVTGYVKKIADYLSSDYKFNSELNKDWYQSGNDVYCTSLANEKIEPGQSKEVKLTVIKEMKENNTGLINNTAEIVNSYNEYGLTDVNSTEANKVKGENDTGSADLIISIKTGQVVMTVSLVISTIVLLGIAIFLIKKIIMNRRLI